MIPSWWPTFVMQRIAGAAGRARRTLLRIEPLETRDTPAGILATGTDPGSAPVVTVYDADTHAQKFTITAYDSSFTGGVNVAVGDANGDGTPDVVTGPGAGGGPVVNVYSGVDGTLLKSFTVGDDSSRAGVSVAAADFDKDGAADIVVGTMRNGEPLVQVLRYSDGTALHGYTPFAGWGSVSVAAGDVNGDGIPDVVAAAGVGGGPQVMVFNGSTDATLMSVFTFEETFTGGVLVSTGDLNGDGYADVITAAGTGGGPRIQVFNGRTGAVLQNFFAYSDALRDGVRAYAYDTDGNGSLDLVTCEGTGQSNEMKAFDATTLAELTAPSYVGLPVGVVTTPGGDTTAPTVAVTTSATSPTKTSPIPFTATFSEAVTGFSSSGLVVTNGTLSNFTATDSKTYTFEVTPTADGTVTVSVTASAASDAAGNGNTASSAASVTYDTTAPVVTANPLTTNSTAPTLTGTVDDSAATVSVVVGGQTITATVSGTSWSAAVPTALTEGTYDISVTATDAAGNTGTTTATGGLVIDTTAPTPTITSSAPEPTNTNPIPVTVTFSENVTGFDSSDVTVTNGTVSSFVATSSTTYTFDVTPTADGTVTVSIPAGAATDAAGNPTAVGTLSVTSDRTAPTATITAASPTKTSPIAFTVTFSEDVTGFVAGGVTVTNGAVSNVTPTDARTYTVEVTPDVEGAVTLAVNAGAASDAAGNTNPATDPFTVTYDTTAPAAPVISGLTPASDSGTSDTDGVTSNTTPTITGTVEPGAKVEVFVDGGSGPVSVGTTTADGTGAWSLTPTSALIDGAYTVTATATDAAGNTSTSSAGFALVIDTATPSVAINPTVSGAVTGTADGTGSAVHSVEVSIRDPNSGLYWDGTAFTSTDEQFQFATVTPTTGNAATWSLAFTGTGTSYTARARVTDTSGQQDVVSATVGAAT
jgi:hypothetical protein